MLRFIGKLDIVGKIILFGLLAAIITALCTSCAGTRNGCPATSGFSGYHSR